MHIHEFLISVVLPKIEEIARIKHFSRYNNDDI